MSNKLNIPEQSKVFLRLRNILASVSDALIVLADTPENYCVDTNVRLNGKEIFFGAIKMRKTYIAYHFMPVYKYPELLKSIFASA